MILQEESHRKTGISITSMSIRPHLRQSVVMLLPRRMNRIMKTGNRFYCYKFMFQAIRVYKTINTEQTHLT